MENVDPITVTAQPRLIMNAVEQLANKTRAGTVKLAESRLGWSWVGRVNGRDDDASRPDLRRPSLPR